jgi:hypothetical protein
VVEELLNEGVGHTELVAVMLMIIIIILIITIIYQTRLHIPDYLNLEYVPLVNLLHSFQEKKRKKQRKEKNIILIFAISSIRK